MPLAPVTISLTTSYSCLNASNPASGAVSLFALVPRGEFIWVTVSTSSTPPSNDNGAIRIGSDLDGFGWKGEAISTFFAGSTATYVHARLESGSTYSGKVVIACA
jgi:hypothetical protein